MDELIILLVRWIIRALGNPPGQRGSPASSTPALPPAWTTAGRPLQRARGTAVQRVQKTAFGRKPPLRQGSAQRLPPPVPVVPDVIPMPAARPATARSHTGGDIRSTLTAATIRKQWVLHELLQPPVALREPE